MTHTGIGAWVLSLGMALLSALPASAPARAADPVVIQIGGGDWIGDSQGQIEANVRWLSRILPRVSADVTTYFGAGNSGLPDVAYWDPRLNAGPLSALARVYAGPRDSRLVTRPNRVPDVAGSTRRDSLVPALARRLQALPADAEVFLVYNGHGGLNWGDPSTNYLRLWDRTRLTVPEMDRLLDQAPAGATLRFVLPQCYSGAFQGLIDDEGSTGGSQAQTRCGFFAQSAFAESEGCSLNVDAESFRDYTTTFFAPLTGRTRQGDPLPVDPDGDGDGLLSYREAHLYALRVADSKDIPRSTAEAFLLDWRPWFLRWASLSRAEASPYWAVAQDIARRGGLPEGLGGDTLRPARTERRAEVDRLSAEMTALAEEMEGVRKGLERELRARWPALAHPYSVAYRRLLETDLAAIDGFLRGNPAFDRLVTHQDRLLALSDRRLQAERALAVVEKVRHLKDLARLEHALRLFGSPGSKATYARLLACEDAAMAPLPR